MHERIWQRNLFILYAINKEEADELYSDLWLKAVELKEKIDFNQNPKSFLLSIGIRLWNNKRRKYAWRMRILPIDKEVDIDTKDDGKALGTEEEYLMKEQNRFIRQKIAELPYKMRIIILLFYMEEMDVASIAKILKIPQGTVKSRLYHARKLLRKELGDYYE